ncbi:MAG TPA: hypothetical protein PLF84_08335 [Bryobacteraceae bacterium]|nr:hypothetical protein [Bryobacterales bacterium]HRJ19037.1 hypothetical protein [Bryobacteraceae bacterium]
MFILRLICVLVLVSAVGAAASAGAGPFKQARAAEAAGRFSEAYLLYAEALAREPGNARYRGHLMAVQRRGLQNLEIQLPAAPESTPGGQPLPPIDPEDFREAARLGPPPVLRGTANIHDFDLEGGGRDLFEKVLGAYGVQVVFDSDYQDPPKQKFRLARAGFREALQALEAVTNSFAVAIHDSIALVARDNAQKRTQIEPYMSVLVPFPEPLTAQEVQEGVRAVQTTFDMTKVGIDNARRLVLFRDRVSRLKPALVLFNQIMAHRAQVLVEVEILSYDERSAISYGLRLPTSFPIVHFGRVWNSTPQIPAGVANFIAFGAGKTLFGIGLTGAQLFADMTRSSVRTLQRVQMLGLDSQPLNFHLGDRYPVITTAFLGGGSGAGIGSAPFPAIRFEDLGIVLKVTPRIHNADEVSMQVEVELKALSGEAANGIPVISNRNLSSTVRMRFDELAVIAGLNASREGRNSSGLPLPFPLRANTLENEGGQLLVTLRPRLVSAPPTDTATPPVRTGSEARPLTPLD